MHPTPLSLLAFGRAMALIAAGTAERFIAPLATGGVVESIIQRRLYPLSSPFDVRPIAARDAAIHGLPSLATYPRSALLAFLGNPWHLLSSRDRL